MLRAILFKEFVKLRRPWLVVLLCNAALMAYVFVETRQLFRLDHAEMVWYRVMHLGQIHYDLLRYAPALTGLTMACLQYLPEMRGERLRLSLHLPASPHALVLAHVFAGLAALGLVLGLDMAILSLLTARYFPTEVVSLTLLTALPWVLAGLVAYLGVTQALLEPSLKLKLFNLSLTAGVVGLFLHDVVPGGYTRALPVLAVPLLLLVPAVLLPAYRFRYRRVGA